MKPYVTYINRHLYRGVDLGGIFGMFNKLKFQKIVTLT